MEQVVAPDALQSVLLVFQQLIVQPVFLVFIFPAAILVYHVPPSFLDACCVLLLPVCHVTKTEGNSLM